MTKRSTHLLLLLAALALVTSGCAEPDGAKTSSQRALGAEGDEGADDEGADGEEDDEGWDEEDGDEDDEEGWGDEDDEGWDDDEEGDEHEGDECPDEDEDVCGGALDLCLEAAEDEAEEDLCVEAAEACWVGIDEFEGEDEECLEALEACIDPLLEPLEACEAAAAIAFYALQSGAPTPGVEGSPSPVIAPVAPESPQENWRVRGSFHLQVFVHDGEDSRRAKEGERVHPGDRLVFHAQLPRDGHLLIAGIDAHDEPYLCYPQNKAGRSAPVQRGSAAQEEAVRLDGVLGTEEIVAVFCDDPFDFVGTVARLRSDRKTAPKGCQQRNFKLQKVQR